MKKTKKRKQSGDKEHGVQLAHNPFDAVPVVPGNVDMKTDVDGCVHLQRRDEPKSAIGKFVSRNLNLRNSALINLDERGSAFWNLIDGARTLADIEREFRREFKLEKKESREATLKFTRDLMVRGLIHLKVSSDEGWPSETQES